MNAIKKHFEKYSARNKQFEHFIEKVPLEKLINNSENLNKGTSPLRLLCECEEDSE